MPTIIFFGKLIINENKLCSDAFNISQMTSKYIIILSIFREAFINIRNIFFESRSELLGHFYRASIANVKFYFYIGFPNRQFLLLLKNDIDFTSMDE